MALKRQRIPNDVTVEGNFQAESITYPEGGISDDAVSPAADIDPSKLGHQHMITYHQADGTDVAAAIVPVYTARGAGQVIDVDVVCVDAPDGGDKAFSVDIKKANQSSPSPATILSAVVDYADADSDMQVKEATIDTTKDDYADGDTLFVVVAVSGSTGTQGQGLVVTITLREDAD